jgi:molecular chaperone GrpE (heat shock protein)
MTVTVELDELVELHSTAKLSEYRQAELERVKNENAETNSATAKIVEEWKARLKEYTDANAELQRTIDTLKQEVERLNNRNPRELQPVTKTAINNAKEVLDAHYRPIVSEEKLADETVPGDRFHAVYNTLRDLVFCLEQEGLS